MILKKAEVKEIYLDNNYYSAKRTIVALYYRDINFNINSMPIYISKTRRLLLELNSLHIGMVIQIFKEQLV